MNDIRFALSSSARESLIDQSDPFLVGSFMTSPGIAIPKFPKMLAGVAIRYQIIQAQPEYDSPITIHRSRNCRQNEWQTFCERRPRSMSVVGWCSAEVRLLGIVGQGLRLLGLCPVRLNFPLIKRYTPALVQKNWGSICCVRIKYSNCLRRVNVRYSKTSFVMSIRLNRS